MPERLWENVTTARGLVAFQIASAVVLCACGTLMVRTLVNRSRVDLGFEPRGAIRADLA